MLSPHGRLAYESAMAVSLNSLAGIQAASFDEIIDVRSPAEYSEDHIPGAISLPVLSDAERARVGTIYTQQARFEARKIGAALVARNAAAHLEGPLKGKDGGWRPLVYCWRGGQRSESFATILSQVGWRADTINGGYRSYRRLVVAMLYEKQLAHRLILLGGNTGTAKTELLRRAAARGVQIIDLEAMAAHRGSLFGAVPEAQPAQKAFESGLAHALTLLDAERPVLAEAESSKIGELLIPPSLWAAMRAAPRLTVTAPLAARAGYLVRAYRDLTEDPVALEARLDALIPFHGRGAVAEWKTLAAEGEFEDLAARLMESHYDRRYARPGSAVSPAAGFGHVRLEALTDADLERAADEIAARVEQAQCC